MSFGFNIGQRKLDFSIDTTWSNESRVEGLDSIRSHDNFDVSSRVETIQLIQKFQHRPLDFTFTSGCRVVS